MTIPSGGRIPFLPAGRPVQPERDHPANAGARLESGNTRFRSMTDRGLSHERNQDRAGNLGPFLNSVLSGTAFRLRAYII